MSTTETVRKVYVLGKDAWGNREVVVQEAGSTHDLPADAQYAYSSQNTKFPYNVAV